MSANTANAIKAYIETLGLGVSVYRDRAPNNIAPPYITVIEGISITSDPAFNAFDDPEKHVVELAQVDVWQAWHDAAGTGVVESYTLADAVAKALDGGLPTSPPTRVMGMRLTGMVRLLDPDQNIVHHALTVEVRRTLTAV